MDPLQNKTTSPTPPLEPPILPKEKKGFGHYLPKITILAGVLVLMFALAYAWQMYQGGRSGVEEESLYPKGEKERVISELEQASQEVTVSEEERLRIIEAVNRANEEANKANEEANTLPQ